MPDPAYNLGRDAIRELQDVVQWYRGWKRNEQTGAAEPFTKFGPRTVRWAKCMANTICSSYPSAPANVFPIRMGELDFDDTACGQIDKTFTPYDPVMDRVALDYNDTYHASGEIVPVIMAHGKWYILGTPQLLAEAFLAQDMCPTDDDDEQVFSVTGATYLPTCAPFTPAKVTDPRHHRGPDGAKVLMVRKKCPDTDEEWQIVDVELTRYCAVIGLEDRDSCLVAAGLRLGGEWCPSDEPIQACNIVDYTDCDTTLPPCDTTWVFEPLFACCGQGTTSSGGSGGSGAGTGNRGPGPFPGQFTP